MDEKSMDEGTMQTCEILTARRWHDANREEMRHRRLGVSLAALLLAPAAHGQWFEKIPDGQVPGKSHAPFLSPDGRYVVYDTEAALMPADNTTRDLYLFDRVTQTHELISQSSSGVGGDAVSFGTSMSPDARYVVFTSAATNLVAGDTNGADDVFLRDRLLGTTERISLGAGGVQGNDDSVYGRVSADGRYVAFQSEASNLVPSDTNGFTDIFMRDRLLGQTERISLTSQQGQATGGSSHLPGMTQDGTGVVFTSFAQNLVPGDNNGVSDIFFRDLVAGTTTLLSVTNAGAQTNGLSLQSSVSGDGRFVVYESFASNLVAGGTPFRDVYALDRSTGNVERVSESTAGAGGDGTSYLDYNAAHVSGDGRFAVFTSSAKNLTASFVTTGSHNVFVRDRLLGTTERIFPFSVGGLDEGSTPMVSDDGRHIAFATALPLDPSDGDGQVLDVYIRSPWFTLSIEDTTLAAGETLDAVTWRGPTGNQALLAITSVGAAPTLIPLVISSFDSLGNFPFTVQVPTLPSLPGLDVGFTSYAYEPSGAIGSTQEVVVHFQ